MTNDNNLRERVEQLEQTVERQATVIERFLPDDPGKRRFLKAGAKGVGAVAGLGLAYDAGTESARAATGDAGQYGSAADRPDMFADEVDANLVSTDELSINGNWTPEVTNRSKNTAYTASSNTWVAVTYEFDTTNRTQATLEDITSNQNIDLHIQDSPNPSNQHTLKGIIPNGNDYKVSDSGSTITIIAWKEYK